VAKKRWPRHAAKCDFDAGITLKKFLRVEGVLSQIERRIGRIPVPGSLRSFRSARPRKVAYRVEAGVGPDLPLDLQVGDDWGPYYSMEDLRWQLDRCPLVESFTLAPSGSPSRVLIWHPPGRLGVCKAALFAAQGSADERTAIEAAISYALEIGAHTLTFNCSRLDGGRLKSLRSAGFVPGKMRIPLHVLNVDEAAAPDALAGLSCLDADMGNRF
jgi:hypothetical protein